VRSVQDGFQDLLRTEQDVVVPESQDAITLRAKPSVTIPIGIRSQMMGAIRFNDQA